MNYEDTTDFSQMIELASSLLEERGKGYICRLLKGANIRIINKEDNSWFGGGITYTIPQILPASAKLSNIFEELDDRGRKTKFLSRSSIYFDDDFLKHLLRNVIEVSAFWNVLSNELVVVFNAPFFPRRVRMGKKYFGFQSFGYE